MLGPTWRIIPLRKWLITTFSFSPLRIGLFPFQMAIHGLQMGVILTTYQVGWSSKELFGFQLNRALLRRNVRIFIGIESTGCFSVVSRIFLGGIWNHLSLVAGVCSFCWCNMFETCFFFRVFCQPWIQCSCQSGLIFFANHQGNTFQPKKTDHHDNLWFPSDFLESESQTKLGRWSIKKDKQKTKRKKKTDDIRTNPMPLPNKNDIFLPPLPGHGCHVPASASTIQGGFAQENYLVGSYTVGLKNGCPGVPKDD